MKVQFLTFRIFILEFSYHIQGKITFSKAIGMFFCYFLMQEHTDIHEAIISIATQRGHEKSTCPSEIARMLFPDDWRGHMQDVLQVAIQLHIQGKAVITQKGKPIDVKHIKGPIRIKINRQ
jgi:hypothetical protein